jgi:hypothetical protein
MKSAVTPPPSSDSLISRSMLTESVLPLLPPLPPPLPPPLLLSLLPRKLILAAPATSLEDLWCKEGCGVRRGVL